MSGTTRDTALINFTSLAAIAATTVQIEGIQRHHFHLEFLLKNVQNLSKTYSEDFKYTTGHVF